MDEKEVVRWIKRGKQKRAIIMALTKPKTSKEIRNDTKEINPHILYQDISFNMALFKQRELVSCLNPDTITGKLHFLTDFGRKVVEEAFGIKVEPLPEDIDWNLYSFVVRATTRKAVLIELGTRFDKKEETTAEIRKTVKEKHPKIGLNPTIRALKELTQCGLVECVGVTDKGGYKLYRLTERGERIVRQMMRE